MEEKERDIEQEYDELVNRYNQLVNEMQVLALRAQMFEEWSLAYKKENEELKQIIRQLQK